MRKKNYMYLCAKNKFLFMSKNKKNHFNPEQKGKKAREENSFVFMKNVLKYYLYL